MKSIRISCAMIVKNEAETLERCLESIRSSVDEIIIVDTGSTDNTVAIAERFTPLVYHFDWINDFSAARNYSLSKCTGDWIFVIDADEYALVPFREQLLDFIVSYPDAVGKIAQINSSQTSGGTQLSQCVLTRFFPNGLTFTGRIHEQLNTFKPRLFTGISVLHEGYLADNKVTRNRSLLELAIEERPEDSYLLFQIARQYFIEKNYSQAIVFYQKAYDCISQVETIYAYLICDLLFSYMKVSDWEMGIDLINHVADSMFLLADFNFTCASFFMEAAFADIELYGHLMQLVPEFYTNCLNIGEDESIDRIQGTGSYLAAFNLAAYYEAMNNIPEANHYYMVAADFGYEPARKRIK